MNSKFTKRMLAYLFDSFILLFLLVIISLLFPNNNMTNLQTELTVIEQNYLFGNINQEVFFNESFEIFALMFKESMLLILFNIVFIIVYHIIIPVFGSYQTLGMKILNIRIMSEKNKPITLSDLVLRNVVNNGLAYLMICLGTYYLLPSNIFIIMISILGIIQVLLVIISCFMIIYKKDRKGIQDIISDTKVIDC